MKEKEALCELLTLIVKAIVDRPEQVDVSIQQGEQTTVYNIRAAPSDLGKVLGRGGSMAAALRKITSAISTKSRYRAIVEIIE